ncbi:MAG: protein kinase [Acidobacteriota bacterium]
MPLSIGDKLGHYEIVAPIGAGGMGEVYRALDTKLNREVALKVLPAVFANNSERMARFHREAQLLASLNHPNIAPIYGLEDTAQHRAIVMELVEGATLKGPLPVAEALRVAKQIAEAIEYAHDKGVIHRDLKPANVMITSDGSVKVLDFGLAKALDDSGTSSTMGLPGDLHGSMSPTLTLGATNIGVILGTAAYMAPEQAKGKKADRRADVWAFGIVLHEILTGERMFSGDSVAEILASVMKEQVTLRNLPSDTPPAVRKLIARCLDRDLRRRVQSIGEARIILEDAIAGVNSEESAPAPVIVKPASKLPWAMAATFFVALLALAAWTVYPRSSTPGPGAIRFTIAPPDGTPLTPFATGGPQVSVSPDGRYLAFVIGTDRVIWVRALGSLSAQKLDKTDGATFPFWSPDSQHIAFFADNQVKRIPVSGGSPVKVADAGAGDGGTWYQEPNGEGVIVFAATPTSALQRVPASGGKPTPFSKLADGETGHIFPQFLPDGKRVLYWARGGTKPGIYVQALGSGERTFVAPTPGRAAFSPPNFLLFLSGNTLMAQRLDLNSLKLEGEPVSIADEVRSAANGRNAFSISSNGVLAYRLGAGGVQFQLTWFTRDGKPTTGPALPTGPNREITLSPDDKFVAVRRGDSEQDLWLLEVATGVFSRLTSSKGDEGEAVWAPDSHRIAFMGAASQGAEVRETVIGSGKETKIFADDKHTRLEYWTRGKQLLIRGNGITSVIPAPEEGAADAKATERKPETVFTSGYGVDLFSVSPDGKWVAYMSQESGDPQIMVAAFPSFANRRQITTGGGTQPLWRADGKELFFLSGDLKLMSVEVKGGPNFETGPARELFQSPGFRGLTVRTYAVTHDGQRFLVLEPPGVGTNTVEPINVIANWPALVK